MNKRYCKFNNEIKKLKICFTKESRDSICNFILFYNCKICIYDI